MKIFRIATAFIIALFTSCLTFNNTEPMELEEVTWEELADKELMEENGNRYVSLEVQFLGPDTIAVPAQMLYKQISKVVLLNHMQTGIDYTTTELVTSLDSFLIALKGNKKTAEFMETTQYGDVIRIIGTTEYINESYGIFKHLLLKAESFQKIN